MRTNYQRGADKERRIVNKFRNKGCLALRSAGSHSPVDVVVVDVDLKEIKLIQAKLGGYLSKSAKKKLLDDLAKFDGEYNVKGELWD